MDILYENRECIACVKPAGVLSQKGKPGERDMVSLLEARQRKSGGLGGVYLIHRLDREVGGVMVFARSHGAAELLARASEQRQLRKEYLAVLRGVPAAPEGTLRDWLARDEKQRKTICVDRAHRGAKEAALSYRVLETVETAAGPQALAHILLHTGRNHQIRVQFASRGTPVLGDERYGGGEEGGMALWAFRLTFPDPLGGTRTVSALPSGGVWERFRLENLT
ncbi:MAG: RluA family pseudouridine synthase [Oscillospiraceae bacterium]